MSYQDVAARVRPDVLIEDDCESIGRTREVACADVPLAVRSSIKAAGVREFEGLNQLPDKLPQLLQA